MNTSVQPLIWLVVAIAGWIQRDQQAAIVYLLKENRVLKARLRRRKLRLTDEERRRLAVKGKAGSRRSKSSGFWVKRHRVGASTGRPVVTMAVLPPLSVGEMTLRFYGALSYSQNSARDLRCALNRV